MAESVESRRFGGGRGPAQDVGGGVVVVVVVVVFACGKFFVFLFLLAFSLRISLMGASPMFLRPLS